MLKMDNLILASKFRGCLLGSLLGDCLGAPYEGDIQVSKVVLQQYFDKLNGPYFKAPVKKYTDDTAMMRCLTKSLISSRGYDPQDLAKRFTIEYFNDPRRGYGLNIVDVFHKLRAQKFEDPYGPAQEQFGGSGSYGNGAAMRVAPIPLYYYNNLSAIIENAKLSARITHSNKNGVDGAVLQAIAIHHSLTADPKEKLNIVEFSNHLLNAMSTVEDDEEGLGLEDPTPYKKQLEVMQQLLTLKDEPSDEQVQKLLGTSIAALYSVPTAIFCFLRAYTNIPEIKAENPLCRTLQYAISLGGDTDTIACMAGAIAGAFYGDGLINESLKMHCEASKDVSAEADTLFELATA